MSLLDMMEARDGMVVGSTSYEIKDTKRAVQLFARESLKRPRTKDSGPFKLVAMPFGEVEDSHWVDRQLGRLALVSALQRLIKGKFGKTEKYRHMPHYRVRRGMQIDPLELDFFFAERVREGLPILQEVVEEDGLEGQRVQVGINTLDLLVFGLKWAARKPENLKPFIERTRMETREIWERTDGKVLFLIEIPSLTILANFLRGKDGLLDWYAEALIELIGALPQGAPHAFHFCDGRLGGNAVGDHGPLKWLGVTDRLYRAEYTVKMSNTVLHKLEMAGFTPEFVQYPFARGALPPSLNLENYLPFREAYIPEGTKVFAGAVSPRRTFEELHLLFLVFDWIFRQRVGMSATCGYGSDSLEDMLASMALMGRLAYV